jgi:hypothetical protein
MKVRLFVAVALLVGAIGVVACEKKEEASAPVAPVVEAPAAPVVDAPAPTPAPAVPATK